MWVGVGNVKNQMTWKCLEWIAYVPTLYKPKIMLGCSTLKI